MILLVLKKGVKMENEFLIELIESGELISVTEEWELSECLSKYKKPWEIEPKKYEFVIVENSYYEGQMYGSIYFGVCKKLSEAQAWLDDMREKACDRYKCFRSPMALKIVCKFDGRYDPQSNRYKTVYKIEPVEIL